jgi:uncharacterized membrane protein YcgQ (UPF0703/DUF1980 family)
MPEGIKSNDRPKRQIRVSYTPNTWIEVDATLSEEEIKDKVERFKQLTNTK